MFAATQAMESGEASTSQCTLPYGAPENVHYFCFTQVFALI